MGESQRGGISVIALATLILIGALALWSYIVFDAARDYVHGTLANNMIEMRLVELKVIDSALSEIDNGDLDKAKNRIEILQELFSDDLQNIRRGINQYDSWLNAYTISSENISDLDEYLENRTFEVEIDEDGISVESYKNSDKTMCETAC